MVHRILSIALTLSAGLAFAQKDATFQYDDFLFHKSGAGMEICGYTGADTDVILPEYVDDGSGRNAVVSIGEEAFYGSRFETVNYAGVGVYSEEWTSSDAAVATGL